VDLRYPFEPVVRLRVGTPPLRFARSGDRRGSTRPARPLRAARADRPAAARRRCWSCSSTWAGRGR